ncbi:SDR family NAD(P)-dependent oxidoreductase [Escherichia coli]
MDFINMFSLKDKSALVTGASYGIGFEIAKALSNADSLIVFNDVIEENIKKGLATYKENNINAPGYRRDITDEQSVKENIKNIERDAHAVLKRLTEGLRNNHPTYLLRTYVSSYSS